MALHAEGCICLAGEGRVRAGEPGFQAAAGSGETLGMEPQGRAAVPTSQQGLWMHNSSTLTPGMSRKRFTWEL